MGGRRVRVLARGQTGLCPGQAPVGVDVEALHRAQVEDDAALVGAVAGQAVAAATDRQLEPRLAGDEDGARDVGGIGGADDQCRARVAERVVDEPSFVVVRAARQDDRAAQVGLEGVEVEDVVDVGADAAEGFHAVGLLGWMAGSGGQRDGRASPPFAAADGRPVANMDIRRVRPATLRRQGPDRARDRGGA